VTLNTTAALAPDDTYTATSFTVPSALSCGASGAWGALGMIAGGLATGQTYTASVWLRGLNGGEVVAFGLNDCAWAPVTLTTTWQRFTFSFPAISPAIANCVDGARGFQVADNSDPGATYFAWGAQVEASKSEGPYVMTNTSAQSGSGGIASFASNTLALGTHSITASYSGDLNFPASTSGAQSQSVTTDPAIGGVSVSSGIVGMAVTISGYEFGATQGSSTVTFNGTPATITFWSGEQIIAIVPQNATSGPLVITVNGVPSIASNFTVESSLICN
jgi:hypothetical protein